jgi:hypothetical protein
MATRRQRGGKREDVIQRSGPLPKPTYRTFDDEEEGDVYACRV